MTVTNNAKYWKYFRKSSRQGIFKSAVTNPFNISRKIFHQQIFNTPGVRISKINSLQLLIPQQKITTAMLYQQIRKQN